MVRDWVVREKPVAMGCMRLTTRPPPFHEVAVIHSVLSAAFAGRTRTVASTVRFGGGVTVCSEIAAVAGSPPPPGSGDAGAGSPPPLGSGKAMQATITPAAIAAGQAGPIRGGASGSRSVPPT